MSNQSTACILVKDLNLTYHFTGVTSITHSLSLKIIDQADITEQGSFVNGAKNQPDSVTLSVVETDAAHSARGWAERMLDVLASVKHRRLLCRVATPHHTYDNMLLSSVTAVQNAAGSLSTAVLAVDPAGTLGMKLQGGGINPNLVRVVNCVE